MTTRSFSPLRSLLLVLLLLLSGSSNNHFLWLVSAGTTPEGLAYLEQHGREEGVIVLDSGLQYKVLQSGSGTHHPAVDSPCLCHYHGTLITGETFDSSYDRGAPTTFAPNQVIKGWTEAMQLMVEGDKWELTLPSELAYGDQGSGAKIPPGSVLVFVIELLEIQGDNKVEAMKCNITTYEHCSDRETKYISKMVLENGEKHARELERLEGMKDSKMKPELQSWVVRRVFLLKQFVKLNEKKEEDGGGESGKSKEEEEGGEETKDTEL